MRWFKSKYDIEKKLQEKMEDLECEYKENSDSLRHMNNDIRGLGERIMRVEHVTDIRMLKNGEREEINSNDHETPDNTIIVTHDSLYYKFKNFMILFDYYLTNYPYVKRKDEITGPGIIVMLKNGTEIIADSYEAKANYRVTFTFHGYEAATVNFKEIESVI